jgi:hypothetical protein
MAGPLPPSTTMERMTRQFLHPRFGPLALAVLVSLPATPGAQLATPITVYKTPTCGCCTKWVDYMRQNGFAPEVKDLPALTVIKQSSGIAPALQSCHTSIVDGYVVEGHVPADLVRKMLKERPKITGIAVPGMPMGSPGMEQGGRVDPYQVIAFQKSGATSVYATR